MSEVYSAYLTAKYNQEIVYKQGRYFPSQFKEDKEDKEILKLCKDKILVNSNILSYLVITAQEQQEYKLSFFKGLTVCTEETGYFKYILDARVNGLYYTFSVVVSEDKDILLGEEICQAFNIEILATTIKDKIEGINCLFCRSKKYSAGWLLNSIKRIKEGKLPLVDIKYFPLVKDSSARAYYRYLAIKAYLSLYPYLSYEEVKAWTDGRLTFPLYSYTQIEEIKNKLKELKKEDVKVNIAVESCADNSLSFCLGIRYYINKKGYNSYLIDPIGNGAKRYVVTNYDKEIKEEDIKSVYVEADKENIIGIYDYKDIKGIISKKEEVKVQVDIKDKKVKLDTTIGYKNFIVPLSSFVNDWSKYYYMTYKKLSSQQCE